MIALLLALLATAAPADEPSALAAQPQGWVDILPPPDLRGWTRLAPISTAGVESWVDPRQEVWRVDREAGLLDCRGDLPAGAAGGGGGRPRRPRPGRGGGGVLLPLGSGGSPRRAPRPRPGGGGPPPR